MDWALGSAGALLDWTTEGLAILRRKAARAAGRILLGPISGQLPGKALVSIDKCLYEQDLQAHLLDRWILAPAALVEASMPAAFPPYFRRVAAFGPRHLYLVKDAVVSPRSGMVWIAGRVLQESVGGLDRLMGWGGLLHEPLLPSRRLEADGPLVAFPATGYYHWLLETVPNLLNVLNAMHDASVVLSPAAVPAYVTECLSALRRRTGWRIDCVWSPFPVRVPTLAVPQVDETSGFARPLDLATLRSAFGLQGRTTPDSGHSSQVYVSRSRSPRRRLTGESALETKLAGLGFRIIYAEEVAFEEQIRLFSQARTVVGPHGAGLANLVWCSPGCRVVEIFPPGYLNDCYAWLCALSSLKYSYIRCGDSGGLSATVIEGVLGHLEGAA